MNKFEEYYINNHKCTSLPQKPDCNYLKISNYLSEYQTDKEKQQVLDNLGVTSKIQEVFNVLNNKFDLYATLSFLEENFVKKVDLYYPEEDDDGYDSSGYNSNEETNTGGYGGQIDDFLSSVSLNPVQNRIITNALNKKADISTLEDYIDINKLSKYLTTYQPLLQAGTGIKIEGNKISTVLDLNPFIFVDTRPVTGNPNKIYLVPDKNNPGVYIQYNYSVEKGWVELGRSNLGSIFSGYLTINEADNRYLKKGDSVGDITLNAVKELLKGYVKKSEVYTPNQYEDNSDDIDDGGNSGSGGGVSPGTGSNIEITIDQYLSNTSKNPVWNKTITSALNEKQDKLQAGEGIVIENGIIYSTFDTSLFEFVTTLPLTNISSSKIYLIEQPDGTTYKEYVYRNGKWIPKGVRDLNINLNKYLSKELAQDLYVSKSDLNGYVTRTEYNSLISSINNQISLDDYATKDYVNQILYNMDPATLDMLIELKRELSEGNLAELNILLSSKANINDVYTKAQCDKMFQTVGNYLTNEQFNNYYNQIINRLESIVIDQTLSLTSEHAVQNKAVKKELDKKLSIDIAKDTYATKTELQSVIDSQSTIPEFKTINGNSILGTGNIEIKIPIIDNILTENSVNAVSSNAIYSYLNEALNYKQDKLIPGNGIQIQNNVISVAIDSNPFIIVDTRPETGIENKLYLVKEGQAYRQYLYINGEWTDRGIIDFNIDLSNYLKISDANFVNPSDLSDLRSWVNTTFVKKSDVYTPDQQDSISNQTDDDSSGGGGSSTPIIPDTPSVGSSKYISSISDGVKTNVAIGNITMGTDVSTLNGKSFSEIFDRMFFKETWNNPNYKHNITMNISNKLVKVGTPITNPTISAIWNSNILPSTNTITTSLKIRKPNQNAENYVAGNIYDIPGTYIFILDYSYPQGNYQITSNYGNTREVTVSSGQGSLTDSVQVTYPWYLNDEEQSVLVPLNGNYSKEIFLTGSPKISIPFATSTCNIQTDLGLGYMDVTWERSTETKNGITYSVWKKQDSYLEQVKHKITFNIYSI